MATYTYSDEADEVRKRAIEEYHHHEYSAETIKLECNITYRCRLVQKRLREIALQAFRDGKFADVTQDKEDLLLVLEYSGLATANESVKWCAIREASGL